MSKYKMPKIEELLAAGVHFGHQTRKWHPRMEKNIYTAVNGIHILDLSETHAQLEKAAEFLYETAKKGGKILFVGTKKQARDIVEIEAKRSGAMYVTERWLGGTFTNFGVIKKNNISKLLELKRRREAGELAKYTKKERLLIDREIEDLEKYVGGLVQMNTLPQVIYIIDSKREKTAVREAKQLGIKVVGFIDTNCNPDDVDFPIPGNDDAIKSIALVTKIIADAIEAGYKDIVVKDEKPVEVKVKKEEKVEEVQVTSSESPAKTEEIEEKIDLSEETKIVVEQVEKMLEEEKKEEVEEVKPIKTKVKVKGK